MKTIEKLNELTGKVTPKNPITIYNVQIKLDTLVIDSDKIKETEQTLLEKLELIQSEASITTRRPIKYNKDRIQEIKSSQTQIKIPLKAEDISDTDITLLEEYLLWLNEFCVTNQIEIKEVKIDQNVKQGKEIKEE